MYEKPGKSGMERDMNVDDVQGSAKAVQIDAAPE